MYFVSFLQQQLSEKTLFYNFFIAYHRHELCDTAASHLKKKLQTFQRNENKPVNTTEEVVTIADNELAHHSGQAVLLLTLDLHLPLSFSSSSS